MTPFGDVANELHLLGWGPLPLPPNAKASPPAGTTGANGRWLSGADVWGYAEDRPQSNVAIRLPPNVIGLDVDAYGDKRGDITLAAHVERYGALPMTWRSTSRNDGISGIYLYRVPPGLWWPGEVGPHVELVQTRHRYAVVPPSVHPERRLYRWVHPEYDDARLPPAADDLPLLPSSWVDALSGGRLAVDIDKAELDPVDVSAWTASPGNVAPMCGFVRTATRKAIDHLTAADTSRHDVAVRSVMSLAYASGEGHTGVLRALEQLRGSFLASVTLGTSARDDRAAGDEWQRIINGALAVIAADGQLGVNGRDDPCAHPLDGLLPRDGTRTIADRTPEYDVASSSWRTPGDALPGQGVAPVSDVRSDAFDAVEPTLGEVHTMRLAIEAEKIKQRVRNVARAELVEEEALRRFAKPAAEPLLSVALLEPPEDVAMRVQALCPTGGNVVLVAGYKAGKTTLVNHLTRCLVDAEPMMGTFAVEPLAADERVGIFNYEVGRGQYLGWLRDVDMRHADRVVVQHLRGLSLPLSAAVARAWVVEWLVANNVVVWVLDPLARAMLGSVTSENDNAEVGAFLDVIDGIKAESGVREVIIPTHTGRMEMVAGMERARGATRVDDWADARWILLRDRDGQRYFSANGRDVELEEGTLSFDADTRSLTYGEGSRSDAAERQRNVGDGAVLDAILFVVTTHPGISTRELRSLVQGIVRTRSDKVDDLARRLESQSRIRIERSGKAHQHYIGGAVE